MQNRIPFLHGLLAFVLGGTLVAHASSAPTRFILAAPVVDIVTSVENFSRFAGPVRAALHSPESGLERKVRLGMEVHLALDAHDSSAALKAARALRELQTNPDERGLTGLMTEAQVASWRDSANFSEELASRLAVLPHTIGTTSALGKMRDKIAGTKRETLLAEARQLGEELDASGSCSWMDADQIVRLRHRLVNIIPLREPTLVALDAAIAARSKN